MLYTTYINQAAWKSFRITCIFTLEIPNFPGSPFVFPKCHSEEIWILNDLSTMCAANGMTRLLLSPETLLYPYIIIK